MNLINGITDQASQSITVPLPDGTKLVMNLMYLDQNMGWYFLPSNNTATDLSNYGLNWNNGQWKENGRRIVSHPNMLRQYRNIINFGLACGYATAPIFASNMREPTNIQDFSSGAFALYTLTAAEVAAFESFLQAQKNAQVPA